MGDSFGRVDVSSDAFIAVRRSFCCAVFTAFIFVDALAGRAVWLMLEWPLDLETLDFFLSVGGLDRLEDLLTFPLLFDLVVFDSVVCTFRLVADVQDLL